MKASVSFFACVLFGSVVATNQAQVVDSLVFNPSFEEHYDCPERIDAIGIMRGVVGWWQPTSGSSDYFHPCGGRECQVPRNKMGYQEAHSGSAYCGIYCSKEEYREYLQTELRHPLAAGRRYHVSFWVSLADRAPFSVASLGALFTRDRLADTTWNILHHSELRTLPDGQSQVIATRCLPQVVNPTSRLLDDASQWVEVCGDFVAEGGELFLTIGNFATFNRSRVTPTASGNPVLPGAYYYIDDVSVRCLDCTDTLPSAPLPSPQAGEVITLRNIFFDTDKSTLLPQSYKDLHDLILLLEAHPTMQLEVRGHTDNQGTAEHNRQLSEARARTVVNYLVDHGIDPSRLTWHGYGKDLPIDSNATDEGRRNNRRVEYKVLHP